MTRHPHTRGRIGALAAPALVLALALGALLALGPIAGVPARGQPLPPIVDGLGDDAFQAFARRDDSYEQALAEAHTTCDRAQADHALNNLIVLAAIVRQRAADATAEEMKAQLAQGLSDAQARAAVERHRRGQTGLAAWYGLSRKIDTAIAAVKAFDWSKCGPTPTQGINRGVPLSPGFVEGNVDWETAQLKRDWEACKKQDFDRILSWLQESQVFVEQALAQIKPGPQRDAYLALRAKIEGALAFWRGVNWAQCDKPPASSTVPPQENPYAGVEIPAPKLEDPYVGVEGVIPSPPADCPTGSQSRATPLDQAVIDEINRARTRPAEYAQSLRAFRSRIQGGVIREPGRAPLAATPAFVAALDDAIAFVEKQTPLQPLKPDVRLTRAAAAFAADQGPKGGYGHTGSDGSGVMKRVQRQCLWAGIDAEVIAYGQTTAEGAVRDLVIDWASVPRAHRTDLFSPALELAGVADAPHATQGRMVVIDLAGQVLKR